MKDVYLPCRDRCTTVRFSYDAEFSQFYILEFLSSYLANSSTSWRTKLHNAWRLLRGKPVYYSEILIEDKQIAIDFFRDCLKAIGEDECE